MLNPESLPIINIIEQSGVKLTKTGDIYAGLCPLHNDSDTPSLRVYPATNSWCCFGAGCGNKPGLNGGGVVEWVKQARKVSYAEAVGWLTGLSLQEISLPPLPKKAHKEKTIADNLIDYWHSLLDKCERRFYYHQRGFTDEFIDAEKWGWDGKRYIIPVWEGEPANSECLGVRRRSAPDLEMDNESKYIGLKDHNQPTVWGRWHCRNDNLILAFAGELDAARAVQDGFAAFSMVNGCMAFRRFPTGWPNSWFPNAEFLLVMFDKKEEASAGKLALVWRKEKGSRSARVLLWPPHIKAKDYNAFRDNGGTVEEFKQIILAQLGK
jgi:hypothetical protein